MLRLLRQSMLGCTRHTRADVQAGRLPAVQILRALAALSVVVGHALSESRSFGPAGAYDPIVNMHQWTAGVDLFFVLSGFIMMWTFGHRFGEPRAWREFLRRRLVRILPPYWVFTSLMIIATLLFTSRLESAVFTPEHALLSFFFIPHIAPHGGIHPILALGWTLMYEMFFYLSFALALCLRRRVGLMLLAAGFLLIHGLSLHASQLPEALRLFWGDAVLFEFLFGIGFYFVQQDGKLPFDRLVWVLLLCAVGSAAASLAGQWSSNRVFHFGLPAVAVFALFYYMLPMVRAPFWLTLVLVGEASYTLYLSHPFVLELAKIPIDPLPVTAGCKVAIYLAAGLLAAVIFSLAFYSLLERRLTRLALGRPAVEGDDAATLHGATRWTRKLAVKARLRLRSG
jgi:exopolysaccharide production protein ExoZ